MLANISNKKSILKKTFKNFRNSNSHLIKIGCELEFFLCDNFNLPISDKSGLESFIDLLKQDLTSHFPIVYDVEKEQGISQIEVKTRYIDDIIFLAEEINRIRNFIADFSDKHNFVANFSGKPFEKDCGSALQYNISIHDKNHNLFLDKDSKLLANAIAGILYFSKEMLFLAVKNKEDFNRFDLKNNIDLHKSGKYVAPTNISFGNNNRTLMLRYVSGRLEYRLPCANSDSFLVLSAILYAISVAIEKDLSPQDVGFDAIYGNSFDEQYKLHSLGKFNSAYNNFLNGDIMNYFNNCLS